MVISGTHAAGKLQDFSTGLFTVYFCEFGQKHEKRNFPEEKCKKKV